MLKAMVNGVRNDKPCKLVILGLSHENLRRLKAQYPIKFDGAEIGLEDTEIVIFAGETERSMGREIAALVGPDTVVRIDPRWRD